MIDPEDPKKRKPGEAVKPAEDALPEAAPTRALTPEEQMALYEDHLKETDWGHQPC